MIMHKCYSGIKYDEQGGIDWGQNMSPMQRKFFELRETYSAIPEDMFTKAFDRCWAKFNSNFEGMDFDNELDPLKMEAESKRMREHAGFDKE